MAVEKKPPRDLVFLALLPVGLALALMLVFFGLRLPLGPAEGAPSLLTALRATGLGLAVNWLWPAASTVLRSSERHAGRLTVLGGCAALLAPVFIMQLAPGRVGRSALDGLLVVTLLWEAMVLNRLRGHLRGYDIGLVLLATLACGIGIALWLATGRGATPFTFEEAMVGVAARDTLFHVSIANMLGGFGALTHGVDGLGMITYHALSHLLIWSISVWTDVAVLDAYPVFVTLVGLPTLLSLSATGAVILAMRNGGGATPTAAVVLLSLLLHFTMDAWRSFYESESQLLGLLFLNLALIGLLSGAIKATIWGAILFSTLAAFAALSKISTGMVMVGAGCVFVLASRRTLTLSVVLQAAVIALPCLAIYVATGFYSATNSSKFALFAFFHQYPAQARYLTFFAVISAVAWVWLLRAREGTRPQIWALGAGLAGGAFLTVIANVAGGSAYYFAIAGLWFGFPMIAGSVALPLERAAASRPILAWAPLVLLLIPLAKLSGLIPKTLRYQNDRVARIDEAAPLRDDMSIASRARTLTDAALMTRAVKQIAQTRGAPIAVQITPGFESYWRGFRAAAPREPCWDASFQQAAMTGMPGVLGLPPSAKGCDVTEFYGLAQLKRRDATSRDLSQEDLCLRTAEMGLSAVVVFRAAADRRLVECETEDP